jgi:cytoskeleton protein RodZ
MSSTPFGEHLRREREMRGVSLDEISAATRISTRFLEAIEKDQWDQLPGGVFNRGFIRSIARFLGLDEDSLVAEYALGNSNGAPAPAAAAPKARNRMPRNWQPAVAAVLVIVLVLAGGIAGLHRYGDDLSAWIQSRYQAVRAAGKSAPEPGPGAPSAATAGAAAATGDPAQVLTLKLQASKATHVKVSADGKIVFDGAVQPGDSRQFDAQSQFDISASDSSAVTLDLNGHALPTIGSPGQFGSVTLTRNDLKTAVGGSH